VPPIVFVLLNALFLVLLYVFVGRAVRTIARDVLRPAGPARAPAPRPTARPAAAAGSSRKPRESRAQPREIVVHVPDGRPRVLPLDSSEIRFGRAPTCTVVLSDTYASEQHARIYPSEGGWVVADMGSTNGTYLNQAKVTSPARISPGDQVGIGKTVVEVRK
jgi:pSer/pThr/pTyr-binding forkhead associated (FHA) protein